VNSSVGGAIEQARVASGLSQRTLAKRTGISQPTLSRIIAGERTAKMTEIILIADVTGHTVSQLTGTEVAQRVQCAARATNGSAMRSMHQQLLRFIELDAWLEDHAIPQAR